MNVAPRDTFRIAVELLLTEGGDGIVNFGFQGFERVEYIVSKAMTFQVFPDDLDVGIRPPKAA